MNYTTTKLAEYVYGLGSADLPSKTVESAKHCILDLIASAAAGYSTSSAMAVRKWASSTLAGGNSSVWFGCRTGVRLSPYAAAVINSASASSLDIDDGHRAAMGHPGAAIIPAAFAAAEAHDASGQELIKAIVAGYEVSVRIAAARDPERLDTLSTGRWCAFGAVAAAAVIMESPVEEVAQALAIAGGHSPGLSVAGYSKVMGNHMKEGIPWGTLTGLAALDLAISGFKGAPDLLDHPDYFDSKKIVRGLGSTFAIETTYFKRYACCRWIHASLDALENIIRKADLTAADILQIEVHTFERALTGLTNENSPATLEGIQYSLPFCLALRIIAGRNALLPIDPVWLGNPEVTELAVRIKLHVDPQLESLFPGQTPARIVVRTATGDYEETCLYPLGDPANPMSREQFMEKFDTLTRVFPAEWHREIIDTIENLNSIKVRDLGMLLCGKYT